MSLAIPRLAVLLAYYVQQHPVRRALNPLIDLYHLLPTLRHRSLCEPGRSLVCPLIPALHWRQSKLGNGRLIRVAGWWNLFSAKYVSCQALRGCGQRLVLKLISHLVLHL